MADYVQKTIAAYDHNFDKYQDATQCMLLQPEFERFVEMVRNVGDFVLDAGCAYGRDTAAFMAEDIDVVLSKIDCNYSKNIVD
ncbi:MAG TPA: hypothetical protein VF272_00935 [Candidatus Saccharimonadia bacterium]